MNLRKTKINNKINCVEKTYEQYMAVNGTNNAHEIETYIVLNPMIFFVIFFPFVVKNNPASSRNPPNNMLCLLPT